MNSSTRIAKRDYYEVLAVQRTATIADIKSAYKRLALRYHPDKVARLDEDGKKEAEEKFKEMHEAYSVLSDNDKRARYDRLGHRAFESDQEPPFARASSNDIFEMMFSQFFGASDPIFDDPFASRRGGFGFSPFFGGGMGGFAHHHHHHHAAAASAPRRTAQALRVDLEISFKQSVRGGTERVTFDCTKRCPTCRGAGAQPGQQLAWRACRMCNGSGRIREQRGIISISTTCGACSGQARVAANACNTCAAAGRIAHRHETEIAIPPGVDTGTTQVITVDVDAEDEGEREGGSQTDSIYELHVHYRVARHQLFRREGDNVHVSVPISCFRAVLGGPVPVPIIFGGALDVQLPPATQPGGTTRVPGYGFLNIDNGTQGDMIIEWAIEIPKQLSPQELQALQALEAIDTQRQTERRDRHRQMVFDWNEG